MLTAGWSGLIVVTVFVSRSPQLLLLLQPFIAAAEPFIVAAECSKTGSCDIRQVNYNFPKDDNFRYKNKDDNIHK